MKILKLILVAAAALYSVSAAAAGEEPRRRVNIDDGWKFHFGHAADASLDFNYGTSRLYAKTAENYGTCIAQSFDDGDWRDVDLPHDWVTELPFEHLDKGDGWSHGFKTVGAYYPATSIGWYRKHFTLPESDCGKRITLTFDGIFRDSRVWINNCYLGNHFSGYTPSSYDITDFIQFGADNVITVRVDATRAEGWFYEGGGIYRHVNLDIYEPVAFTRNGIFITSVLDEGYGTAEVNISAEVESFVGEDADIAVTTYVYDNCGHLAAVSEPAGMKIGADAKVTAVNRLTIADPQLWDIDSPHLYRAVCKLVKNGILSDVAEVKFGVRDIVVDRDKGLFLNGRPVKIKGVCCHQDHAGVGSAIPDFLQYYRIRLLKETGVNAYRTSHNAPTPELLDVCDSLGMLVLDETRLTNSSPEYMGQLEDLVLRDRNHPCVFMWSVGNEEERLQSDVTGRNIALSMMRRLRKLDLTRSITYGANNGFTLGGINEVIEVRGFNYNLDGIDPYRAARPDQPLLGTEVASTVATRGIYAVDSVKNYLSDYDLHFPPWASTAEQWWTIADARDYFMGGFIWTGFDYRGEPTPFKWPNISSHFGIMDMCGFPKTVWWYYRSWWNDDDVLHIAPHWNWRGREGENIKVWVNSNAASVELFLNGRSLGSKQMPRNGHLEWDVPYRAGKLRAVARTVDGRRFERTVETTAEPVRIVLKADRTEVMADRRDGAVVNVEVCDARGRAVPDAGNMIRFTLEGDGRILGTGNGDPSCHEPDTGAPDRQSRSLFGGKCQVLIGAGRSGGELVLTAEADGLQPARIVITQKQTNE